MYAQYVGNLLPSQFALLTQIHGQAPHLVLSFSRELSGIDLFHAYLYREFDCRVNTQPIGEFYSGSIKAKDLVKISYADVRRMSDNELDQYLGIQRPLKQNRVKQISEYISTIDASFPSSIIIAIDEKFASWNEFEKKFTISSVDDTSNIALILDGQHRLAGFNSENVSFIDSNGEEKDFELLVTIFVGIDISTSARIFATVNLAQTKVNKSLVYDLEALANLRSPDRTAHDVAVVLNSDEGGAFYKSIKRLGVATPGVSGEFLTQAAFVESLTKYITPNSKMDRDIYLARQRDGFFRKKIDLDFMDKESLSKFFFRKAFEQNRDEIIAANISNFFSSIKSKWNRAWTAPSGSSLNKTIGFQAMMDIFEAAYREINIEMDWDIIIKKNIFDDFFSECDISDDYFFDMDPNSKTKRKIFDAIMGSLSH